MADIPSDPVLEARIQHALAEARPLDRVDSRGKRREPGAMRASRLGWAVALGWAVSCGSDSSPGHGGSTSTVADCVDADGDGHGQGNCQGLDCDDHDKTVYPAAPELCDGKDNDCNGVVDDDCPTGGGGAGGALPDAGTDAPPDVVEEPGCVSDSDCDDAFECTVDTCLEGTCLHAPARDGTPCASQTKQCRAGTCACPVGLTYQSSFSFVPPTADHLDSLVIADVDGDGDRDVLLHVDADAYQNAWGAFSNDGLGNFTPEPSWMPIAWGNGQMIFYLGPVDLDGDARDDLVGMVANAAQRRLVFLKNNHKGIPDIDIFQVEASFTARSNVNGFCSGDLDGNGKEDFLYPDTSYALHVVEVDKTQQTVVENTSSPLAGYVATSFQFCAVADLDGDQLGEVIVGRNFTAHVLKLQGGAYVEVASQVYSTFSGTSQLKKPELPSVRDVDGDGFFDLVSSGAVRYSSSLYGLAGGGQAGEESASFATLERTCLGLPHFLGFSPGVSDFAHVYWNTGTQALQELTVTGGPSVGCMELAFHGDVNGDGLEDFIGAKRQSGGNTYVAKVFLAQKASP